MVSAAWAWEDRRTVARPEVSESATVLASLAIQDGRA
jgi:hypothetical protein